MATQLLSRMTLPAKCCQCHLPHVGRHNIENLAARVSHQSLLLQAQDDQVENKKAERQNAAIQNPELADGVSQEGGDDEVLSKHPCSSNTTAARLPSSNMMKQAVRDCSMPLLLPWLKDLLAYSCSCSTDCHYATAMPVNACLMLRHTLQQMLPATSV